ncbi:MAG: caspase family protein [Waddliaceae bacterium]
MAVQTIAIVIGISHYQQKGIPSLPAAERDAVNFARALRNWRISEENIFLLLNQDASKEIVDNFFTMLLAREEHAKFIFYFCGHGHRTQGKMPRSFLMFSDTLLTSDHCLNAFSLDGLFERVAKMNMLESYLFILLRRKTRSFMTGM